MVSASFLPLLALVLARVAGLSGFAAANVGLVTAVVVLVVHAWAAGRSARLHGRQLLFTISIAAGLGLAMIVLKDVVLTHVHQCSSRPGGARGHPGGGADRRRRNTGNSRWPSMLLWSAGLAGPDCGPGSTAAVRLRQ
jgi:hypothetical protein